MADLTVGREQEAAVAQGGRSGTGGGSGGSGRGQRPEPNRSAARRPVGPSAARPDGAEPATDLQRQVAARSMPALLWLHRLPRWVVLVGLAVLLIAGLAVEGVVGGVLLLVLAAFLGWLLLLSWPLIAVTGRLSRVIVVALVAGAGVLKILG